MSSERTLVFLKPESVTRRKVGQIISRIEETDLVIVAAKMLLMTRPQAERFYEIHKDKKFYDELVSHVTSGPILAMVLEGPNAVSTTRSLIGATNPIEATPGTIRRDFGFSTTENAIHASDSVENAIRESRIIFEAKEILSYH